MTEQIERKFKKLKIRPESDLDKLTLYPANYQQIWQKIYIKKQDVIKDVNWGPKPGKIEKYIKKLNPRNKVVTNKNKSRGGKRKQIAKNIEELKKIVSECKSEEEKNRFNLLIVKAKNDLNRLRKKKNINK